MSHITHLSDQISDLMAVWDNYYYYLEVVFVCFKESNISNMERYGT